VVDGCVANGLVKTRPGHAADALAAIDDDFCSTAAGDRRFDQEAVRGIDVIASVLANGAGNCHMFSGRISPDIRIFHSQAQILPRRDMDLDFIRYLISKEDFHSSLGGGRSSRPRRISAAELLVIMDDETVLKTRLAGRV
jgi:hypothetical protein